MARATSAIAALGISFVAFAAPLRAQGVELMPFGGYRFGGDFFELVADHPVDLDGSPALGFVLNIPLSDGLQVEALVTRQSAYVSTPTRPLDRAARWYITVDHVQRFLACTPGTCISSVNVEVVWQAEFSAGLIVRLR